MTGQPDVSLVLAYGSDMGNAEDAALSFAEACEAAGIEAEAIELNQLDLAALQSATHFVAVTSTFGDGDFPDNAALFWEAFSANTDRLEHLSFAVLALGDMGYDLFCHAGKLLDDRLELLGATRLVDRIDIDGFYEKPAAGWTADVVKQLSAEQVRQPAVVADNYPRERNQPHLARVTVNRLLTAAESDKEVRHYELDLTGSGIAYHAGDSIAVHATNDPVLVDSILTELGASPHLRVADHDEPLGALLSRDLEIRTPSRALQVLVADKTQDAKVAAALRTSAEHAVPAPGSWAYGKDVLDLLRLAPLTAEELVDTLRPLQFRDYSIASSAAVHPDRVHLTVSSVRYTAGDRTHGGVASTFLADRCETVRVHLRPNHTFRLPADHVPIIMIGPGTGIAPFRAFLQERHASRASGRSWLFFGDRRRATDFLYGDELTQFAECDTLTKLDLAFSRDRTDGSKEYVQHRMLASAEEFFGWLEDGAYVYVCGDADRMAKDVDAAVHDIVARSGGMTAAGAHAYVNELIKIHRYVRDVY